MPMQTQEKATITFCLLTLTVIIFVCGEDYKLTILHVNDVHARIEQTSVYSGRCSEEDIAEDNCFGGFPRIQTAVTSIRSNGNVLFLAAGDYFQGTVWYTVHKWKVMAYFLNILNHDAMALGNHEFDNGLPGLVPFLENVTFPVLAANIRDDEEESIQGKYAKSAILEKGGRKIGIIGYLTTETEMISNPGKLDITDEVNAVREEAKKLKKEGVNILIALGHAGFQKDLGIAKNVEDIDAVVGGHTNTFLYNGNEPSTEESVGEYPVVVEQSSGRKVPVVQAYAFGKYLGYLNLTIDEEGEVTKWEGNPILLDNSVEQDPDILEELKPWREEIDEAVLEEIGKTYVFLDGRRLSCRMRECNLGNLETDAIIHMNTKYPDDQQWARTSLAVINGGGIRSSIDEQTSNGTITMEDVLTAAPFQNTIDIVELYGRHVKEMFEYSVSNYDPEGLSPPGGFLQVAGFEVVYDVTKPQGSRVLRLQARCVECRIPALEDIRDDTIYKIAMPSFLANGGDGYTVISDNKVDHHLTGLLDSDVYTQYISVMSPIYQGVENRIIFMDADNTCNGKNCSVSSNVYTNGCFILLAVLILFTIMI